MTPEFNETDNAVAIGSRFGSLEVVGLRRGKKAVHPVADCVCACGRSRAVRQTKLRRGAVFSCASCAMKEGWKRRPRLSAEARRLLERESEYRSNAAKKKTPWKLSRAEFQALLTARCFYCDTARPLGVDRLINKGGYTPGNVVPCCSDCNYAKRMLSVDDFLALVRRIYAHRCAP